MIFRVEMTPEAEANAETILEWLLSEGAGDIGIRWFLALEDALASLADFPERCPLAPETAAFPFEVRQLLYGRKPDVYRILFNIDGDIVVFCTFTTAVACLYRIRGSTNCYMSYKMGARTAMRFGPDAILSRYALTTCTFVNPLVSRSPVAA